MGVAAKSFEGISTRIPGVYSKSEFPPTPGGGGAALNIVAVIGESLGGIPYNAADKDESSRINVISSIGQALNELIGGNGFYMTEFYLTPTKNPSLALPQLAVFIRVNPALRASRELLATLTPIIQVSSARYGSIANQLATKLEAGANIGHKITLKFKGEIVAEEDDVGFEYMEIQYVGGDAGVVTMTITDTTLTLQTSATSEDDFTLDLVDDHKTVGSIVSFIDEQSGYTVILKGKSDDKSSTFDAITTQDIKTSTYIAVAHIEAIIQMINFRSGGEFTANLKTGAVRTDVNNDSTFVFLTSGSNGIVTNTNWAAAFDLAKKLTINHILVATDDAGIHAIASTHVNEMSKIEEGKNRTAASGAGLTDTNDVQRAEAKAINDARFEYFGTSFKRPDLLNNNKNTEFAPFYGAAFDAGIRYGGFITLASTFKDVNVTAVTRKYNRTTADTLISDGVSLLHEGEDGIEILREITTIQSGASVILNIPSMLRTTDFITLDSQSKLKIRMKNLTRAPNALVIKDMQNYILTNLLPSYVNDGLLTNDPNTGDPAFRDIEFSLAADSFKFSFTGIVPAPLLFIFVKQKFTVVGSI